VSKTRQVALLRGINLGGRARVEMARLRDVIQALGYDDVRTHLQSGNVVFASDKAPEEAAHEIEGEVAERLGVAVPVLVRTRDELAKIVERNPLGDVASDPKRYLVTFLSAPPDRGRLRDLDAASFEPEVFRVIGREAYVWSPGGVRASQLSYAFWEKHFQLTATARNWNTVTKLLTLANEEKTGGGPRREAAARDHRRSGGQSSEL
jgi:uncharacterized protein (DUF1697 family)